jgi:hypothetical protein
MPKAWTRKDERKYEHIKKSSRERGASPERAKEIAARTVNRDRRRQGRTPNRRTRGTGAPRRRLEDRSRQELYNLARQRRVANRSKMSKQDLIEALR